MYTIVPHKRVIKFINSRTQKEKDKIKNKFLELESNPYPTNPKIDTKKLKNRVTFRLRIGGYGFIYEVVDSELVIYMDEADNRGDIY